MVISNPVAQVSQVRCEHCGTLNDTRQLACVACGGRLVDVAPLAARSAPPPGVPIAPPTQARRPIAATPTQTPAVLGQLSESQCVLSCLLYLGGMAAGVVASYLALLSLCAGDLRGRLDSPATEPTVTFAALLGCALVALVCSVAGLALARLADELVFRNFPEAQAAEVSGGAAAQFAANSLWLAFGGFGVCFVAFGLGLLLSPLFFLAASRMGWRALREPVNHRLRRRASIGVALGLAGVALEVGMLAYLAWGTLAHLGAPGD